MAREGLRFRRVGAISLESRVLESVVRSRVQGSVPLGWHRYQRWPPNGGFGRTGGSVSPVRSGISGAKRKFWGKTELGA